MKGKKPNRLDVWDYDSYGYYYVTITTRYQICFFGQIQNGNMKLSKIGRIAYKCWIEVPDHFRYASLDEFIIMPNHFHGIIKIWPSLEFSNRPQNKKLPIIIGSYKSAVSKSVHKEGFEEFAWHKSYYDNIVRDKGDLNRIRRYISNNPSNWGRGGRRV